MNVESIDSGLEICRAISSRLEARGVARQCLAKAFNAARINGTSFCDELACLDTVDESMVYEAIADYVGVTYADDLTPAQIFSPDTLTPAMSMELRQVMAVGRDGRTRLYTAPAQERIALLQQHLRESPELAARMRICPPSSLRRILRERYEKDHVARAHGMTPEPLSAAQVIDTPQAFAIAMAAYALVAGLVNWPGHTLFVLHVALSLLFFGCVLIRLFAAAAGGRLRFPELKPAPSSELPVYTVLVPLYREREVVDQLVTVLGRLNWPRSKLDVKLVCEKDDAETIAAIRARSLPSCFELVLVPAGGPRTKPKALNYALQFARGALVAVFDAEDRPHPDQLREAWQAFRDGDERLACVQAPLIIGNFRSNLLTRMFAFEYAALFRGLLPWLAARGLVIPLGGTSNHFRRDRLEEAGGWDAYNVTEDADLGVRLARFGYRIGVISRGTIEDAPESYAVWRRQRTRWLKGWMQTWLVHARRPHSVQREMGWRRFLFNQVYTVGVVGSALLHPLMLAMLVVLLPMLALSPPAPGRLWLAVVDVSNIVLAYTSFYVLGLKTMEPTERRGYTYLLAIPVYWVFISLSAWRALGQLMRRPHFWEKTPHQPSLFYRPAEAPRNAAPLPITD